MIAHVIAMGMWGVMLGQAGAGPDQATIIGWVVIGALAVSSLALNVRNFSNMNKAQKREVSFDPERVDKAVCAAKHEEVDRRFARAEGNIGQLWTTLRAEIQKVRDQMEAESKETRSQMARGFQDVDRALGRIEGSLKE